MLAKCKKKYQIMEAKPSGKRSRRQSYTTWIETIMQYGKEEREGIEKTGNCFLMAGKTKVQCIVHT